MIALSLRLSGVPFDNLRVSTLIGSVPINVHKEDTMAANTATKDEAAEAETATPEAATPQPAEKTVKVDHRNYIFTPFEASKAVNAALAAEGIIDPKTGEVKKVGSPMLYIYARKEAFKVRRATKFNKDGSTTQVWEVDQATFKVWLESYISGVKTRIAKATGEDPEADSADAPTAEAEFVTADESGATDDTTEVASDEAAEAE